MEQRCYVVLYDNKGDKSGGFDCYDPLNGLTQLAMQSEMDKIFSYVSASCFIWKPDILPLRQWHVEID